MTFTIYEKHPTLDAYRYGPSFTPYAIVAVDKRFSDAELAAELHNAARDEDMHWVQTGEDDGPLSIIVSTLERFATLPHFDE
jgi:hypothetical protein